MTGPVASVSPRRRRERLSDAQTAERMIAAALELIQESGLTVSLEHLSFEEVIRRADVSRTAAYRRWKYKDDFVADLLRELARDPYPAAAELDTTGPELARMVVERLDLLDTVEGRRRLVELVVRLGTASDLVVVAGSARWRSFLALQAAVLSLDDGGFRDELMARLAESDRLLRERIGAYYRLIAAVAGLRLVPGRGVDFEDLGLMSNALLIGIALKAQTDPSLLGPAGLDPDAAARSLAASGVLALFEQHLEVDPDIVWDEERLAEVRAVVVAATTELPTLTEPSPELMADLGTRLLGGPTH